jgi:hypothetical protein
MEAGENYMNDDANQTDADQFENNMSPATPQPSLLVETREIVFHREPRISANKLAEYVLADESRKKTIIREAKFAKKLLIVPYSRTRKFIAYAFAPDSLDIDKLVGRAEEIERENDAEGISEWQRNDNTNSALALKKLASLAPELSWKDARILHERLGGIVIAGVKVSVQPELVFRFEHRNIPKVGAIILNTAKGDEKSLGRNNGGYCIGDYLSSLLFQMLLSKSPPVPPPLNSKCFAVDVFREQVYTAPANYRKLSKNLEAACEVIALRWPEIQQAS